MVCNVVNVQCLFKPYFSPSASDCGRRSLESEATWIEWQRIGFVLDNHSSATHALDIICYDFGNAIEAQKTMKTRPTIIIPILTQTEFLQFGRSTSPKLFLIPETEPGWSVYPDFEVEWHVGS
jgi:hypothetical protein